MPSPDSLQVLTGPLEVKFKMGAFSTWSTSFVRLEGRWICVYKKEDDSVRQGAIELGLGVSVTDILNTEASSTFPRRFDLVCTGGLLPKTKLMFRTKSRKDRDQWVQAISTNLKCLTSVQGQDPNFAVWELFPVVNKLQENLVLYSLRVRSDLTVRCATGDSIVTFLVHHKFAPDRVTATALGRHLVAMNLLHHIMCDRDFTDSPEPFVVAALDQDVKSVQDIANSYHVTYFLKYMDSRKFWKYIACPDVVDSSSHTVCSTISSGGRRAGMFHDRLTSSSDSGQDCCFTCRLGDEMKRHSSLSGNKIIPLGQDNAEKKIKSCTICTKSFNPLRRRYYCHHCRAVVCSNCSVLRKRAASNGDGSHTCINCKLILNDTFVDDIPEEKQNATDRLPSDERNSTNRHRSRSRNHAARNGKQNSSFCLYCQNTKCAPFIEFSTISNPVDPPGCFIRFENEKTRLESVKLLLDTLAAPHATQMLRQFCNMAVIASKCHIAVIGLIDEENYIVISQEGVSLETAVPREQSLTAHTCHSTSSLVCADLTRDVRFIGNPWRQKSLPNVKFYAGIPLILSNGHVIGALEVLDYQPRFECGEVVNQLQSVVRGLLNLFEDMIDRARKSQVETEAMRTGNEQEVKKQEEVCGNPMKEQLLELLSQTTSTQEQLRYQQDQMVSAITSHSKQIDNLTMQLERIEATLVAKLS